MQLCFRPFTAMLKKNFFKAVFGGKISGNHTGLFTLVFLKAVN